MADIKNIIVVCTGNACRSPMAEGFLKKLLPDSSRHSIASAGISAVDGFAPTPAAVQAMQEHQIDISCFRSSCFSRELARASDIILVMAKHHRDFISENMPDMKEKAFLYKEFAGIEEKPQDIQDPIGQPIEVYRIVCNEIKAASEKIAEKILRGYK
jgi:protein-tyrosine-phosphatase